MGEGTRVKLAVAVCPATTVTDWTDEMKPMRRASSRRGPAASPLELKRPALSVTAALVVPTSTTATDGTGRAPSDDVTRPVTLPTPCASADVAMVKMQHIASTILRPIYRPSVEVGRERRSRTGAWALE